MICLLHNPVLSKVSKRGVATGAQPFMLAAGIKDKTTTSNGFCCFNIVYITLAQHYRTSQLHVYIHVRCSSILSKQFLVGYIVIAKIISSLSNQMRVIILHLSTF